MRGLIGRFLRQADFQDAKNGVIFVHNTMAEIFRAKVRQIGTSAGILISRERLQQEAISIGDEIELAILPHAKDFSGFGLAKSARIPFVRDKKTRNFP